eukprot:UN4760
MRDEASIEMFAEHLLDAAARGDEQIFLQSAANTLNIVTDKYMPEWKGRSIVGKHKMLVPLLRSISPSYLFPSTDADYGGELRYWGPLPAWIDLETEMWERRMTVPRMFLYSLGDKLYNQAIVEGAVDKMWRLFKGSKVTILAERCTKALHMKLWQTERSTCEKAVNKYLKVAKLNKF